MSGWGAALSKPAQPTANTAPLVNSIFGVQQPAAQQAGPFGVTPATSTLFGQQQPATHNFVAPAATFGGSMDGQQRQPAFSE